MSNQRLTQCPHCKASFKVSEEQLSAADGRVRCGACMSIFDAIAYTLSSTESKTPNTPESESLTDLEESLIQEDKSLFADNPEENLTAEEENLFADNPEEDLQEAGYSGITLPSFQ